MAVPFLDVIWKGRTIEVAWKRQTLPNTRLPPSTWQTRISLSPSLYGPMTLFDGRISLFWSLMIGSFGGTERCPKKTKNSRSLYSMLLILFLFQSENSYSLISFSPKHGFKYSLMRQSSAFGQTGRRAVAHVLLASPLHTVPSRLYVHTYTLACGKVRPLTKPTI